MNESSMTEDAHRFAKLRDAVINHDEKFLGILFANAPDIDDDKWRPLSVEERIKLFNNAIDAAIRETS